MTQEDLYLVIGIVILVFAVPAIFGAFAERRVPRVPAIMVLIGGTLVVLAVTGRPGGYDLSEIPNAFVRVIAYFFR